MSNPHDISPQIERVLAAIAALAARVDQLHSDRESGRDGKEWYTTSQFAALKGVEKAEYTVREWCRWGRINAVKAQTGRGIDSEWRISHGEYVRYLNEGLLPPPRYGRRPKS
jgi:hypothetical protein